MAFVLQEMQFHGLLPSDKIVMGLVGEKYQVVLPSCTVFIIQTSFPSLIIA